MDPKQQYVEDVVRLGAESHKLSIELRAREKEVDGVKCRISKVEQQLVTAAEKFASRSHPSATSTLEERPVTRSANAPPSGPSRRPSGEGNEENIINAMRRHRPQTSQMRKSGPSRLEVIHPDYQNVIWLDDAWTELWCSWCGTNCTHSRQIKLFAGAAGLHNHWRQVHTGHLEDHSLEACLANAGRRIISSRDAELMRAGTAPQNVEVKTRFANDVLERMFPGTKVADGGLTAGPAFGTPVIVADAAFTADDTLHTDTTSHASLTSTAQSSARTHVKTSKRPASTSPHALLPRGRLTGDEAHQNLEPRVKADESPRSKKQRPAFRLKYPEETAALNQPDDEAE
ncbi:hypothetical protein LTR12_008634 [Friedmanniomyces endolithicus]|nr:hypothetical protein LTR12_008634 [Friedmanniomyces endolithicus]